MHQFTHENIKIKNCIVFNDVITYYDYDSGWVETC